MKNLLLYKLILFNVLLVAWGLGTAGITERIGQTFGADTTGVSYLILAFFGATFLGSVGYAWVINKVMNIYAKGNTPDSFRGVGWVEDIDWIAYSGAWMLFLGLIGTLMGLQISLEGVNTGNLSSLEGIKALAVKMVQGLRIEISTTIIGAAACLWTEMNFVIIRHSANKLARHENNIKKIIGM